MLKKSDIKAEQQWNHLREPRLAPSGGSQKEDKNRAGVGPYNPSYELPDLIPKRSCEHTQRTFSSVQLIRYLVMDLNVLVSRKNWANWTQKLTSEVKRQQQQEAAAESSRGRWEAMGQFQSQLSEVPHRHVRNKRDLLISSLKKIRWIVRITVEVADSAKHIGQNETWKNKLAVEESSLATSFAPGFFWGARTRHSTPALEKSRKVGKKDHYEKKTRFRCDCIRVGAVGNVGFSTKEKPRGGRRRAECRHHYHWAWESVTRQDTTHSWQEEHPPTVTWNQLYGTFSRNSALSARLACLPAMDFCRFRIHSRTSQDAREQSCRRVLLQISHWSLFQAELTIV